LCHGCGSRKVGGIRGRDLWALLDISRVGGHVGMGHGSGIHLGRVGGGSGDPGIGEVRGGVISHGIVVQVGELMVLLSGVDGHGHDDVGGRWSGV
jgi:hypothetical protein